MKNLMTVGGLVVVLLLFLGFNVLTGATLRDRRIDLTENKLYTLSDGTVRILETLPEKVTLRFYFSKKLAEPVAPQLISYAQRVQELLEEYASRSNGKLVLEVADPEPFSEIEDRAANFGLKGVPTGVPNEKIYFGLAGTNTTDQEEIIELFSEQREEFLEYDVTKLVYTLSTAKKPVVGLLSTLPLEADPMARMANPRAPAEDWLILDVLRQTFDVRTIVPTADTLDPDLAVLVVVHPQNLPPATLFAIDQFVLRGGKLLAFIDPRCEIQQVASNPQNPLEGMMADRSSTLGPLLDAWGLEMSTTDIAADKDAALRVPYGAEGETADVVVLIGVAADKEMLSTSDPVTSDLQSLNLYSAGVLTKKAGATTAITPLFETTKDSMRIETSRLQFSPKPDELLESFVSGDQKLMLAARVTGNVKSAFPEGRPQAEGAEGAAPPTADEVLAQSLGPINVIVVADADLLHEQLWAQVQNFAGTKLVRQMADNGNLAINAVDNLCGSNDLISLRSRGRSLRPFDRVVELRRQAESKLRDKQKELLAKMEDAEKRISDLQSQKDNKSALIISPEQQAEIERFREQRTKTGAELRQVQHELNKDIEALKSRLVFYNAAVVPLLVAATGLGLWFVRRKRMQNARQRREGN